MEEAGPDVKRKILEELSGDDLLNLCNSSEKLKMFCKNKKNRSFWIKKLEKDFAIIDLPNDIDPFKEYKFQNRLSKQEFFNVLYQDGDNFIVGVFVDKMDALEYIIENYASDFEDLDEDGIEAMREETRNDDSMEIYIMDTNGITISIERSFVRRNVNIYEIHQIINDDHEIEVQRRLRYN